MNQHPVAIVVGASGGVGRTMATMLSDKGYSVIGTSRKGGEYATLDVCDQTSVDALVETVSTEHGRIDVLINNAGYLLSGSIEAVPMADAMAQFDTNYFGAIRMARAVLPVMRDARRGRIINIGSVLGFLPFPFAAHYTASKHAMRGFSEAFDHEIRSFRVRSILIEPGNMTSGFDAATVHHPDTSDDYRTARGGFDEAWSAARAQADDPSIVNDAVWRAVSDPNPRLRYVVGKGMGVLDFARHKLPARMFDRTMRKQFRLPAV